MATRNLRWLLPIGLLFGLACGGSRAASPASTDPAIAAAWENNGRDTGQRLANQLHQRFGFAKYHLSRRRQRRDPLPWVAPPLVAVEDARYLADNEPVIALEQDGVARAYPLQILVLHEVVNDTVAGRPLLISYCPLCNSAIVFDRVVDGRTLEFGVSGFLSKSDLIMFDRDTESWWQQLTGEAIVGDRTGQVLGAVALQHHRLGRLQDGVSRRCSPTRPASSTTTA